MINYYSGIENKIKESTKDSGYSVYIPKEAIKTMKYINRAGDVILASYINDGQLKLEGFDTVYIRVSIISGTDAIRWIDFSGGPMISLEDDLGTWFKELDGIKVKSLESINGIVIIGI